MNAAEESDRDEVPMNQPNKEAQASAEVGEGRSRSKENIEQSHTPPAQNGERVFQGLIGVRRAKRDLYPDARFDACIGAKSRMR